MIDEIRLLLERRLVEIADESRQLERAIKVLGGRTLGRRPAETRKPPKDSRRPTTKRAAPGERQRQLIAAIKKMPGATTVELAGSIGVADTQAYGMVRSLEEKGQIKKKGKRFEVVG